jgi:hypothetical protein
MPPMGADESGIVLHGHDLVVIRTLLQLFFKFLLECLKSGLPIRPRLFEQASSIEQVLN